MDEEENIASSRNSAAENRAHEECGENQHCKENTDAAASADVTNGNWKEAKIKCSDTQQKVPSAPVNGQPMSAQTQSMQYKQLTLFEKKFLLAVERGDLAGVRRYCDTAPEDFNINCCDPLGRSALLMAIDNENLDMIELLIDRGVEMKDALLHAINEEFVESVELLLDQENQIHVQGTPHSWESAERETFTADVTPLILAAHKNNYEIIKILLDRGISPIPCPHDARCGCEECTVSRADDCLRHSRSRLNAYRALSSPSLIALSSKDPILTAFELSWELRRLSFLEPEFKVDYIELRKQCQTFATALLDHTRTTQELEILLNYDPRGDVLETCGRMNLARLKLAIRYKQKKFCAHPNVQQLLASIWYEGLPGFRRKNIVKQTFQILFIGLMFPILSLAYVIAPYSRFGRIIKKPFIKFICHSASFLMFLILLALASQRIETKLFDFFRNDEAITKRGAPPTLIELMILAWVLGLIWSEIKQLWELGLLDYLSDMWNILDFVMNSLYVATITLRVIAYLQVQKEIDFHTGTAYLPRFMWNAFDPILLAEGLFAAANIFSSLKLVYIFSVNPHLGPLQISLGRMVIDILKFFCVYILVLFAFACGMNQLLWYYAEMEKLVCLKGSSLITGRNHTSIMNAVISGPITGFGPNRTFIPKSANEACLTWRRFVNLFETAQTLFWASFGLIDLESFELTGIQSYTRFWGLLMFGSYCVINVLVLLNMLIAMMNHSYQVITEQADTEWKFARTKLWMSYFEDGATVPPPFNIIPTPKTVYYLIRWFLKKFCSQTEFAKNEAIKTIRRKARQASERDHRYQNVMRALVRRYITNEQRTAERQRGVTEDDCNEIKQDISALRYELIELLGGRNRETHGTVSKRGRQKERRLMKGFDLNFLFMDTTTSFDEDYDSMQEYQQQQQQPTVGRKVKSPSRNKFVRLARGLAGKRNRGNRWRQLIEATRSKVMPFSRSSESVNSESTTHGHRQISATASLGRVDSNLDASIRRSMFARKVTTLLQEEANNLSTDLEEDNQRIGSSYSADANQIIAVTRTKSKNEWI
ncbi:transient receptor potential-gamma protein-like protein [Dinothrombium tinctorium]|uniref:Transient receptor potential-gamma protein-like protein n=1 Tax=Dinothrombium tinctorium TaxID=1965070 RepID=A0A3S3RXU2_9ACAR|nr:transient receptor potential-gamma protein-like protein [Dinothrombium tinctorium]